MYMRVLHNVNGNKMSVRRFTKCARLLFLNFCIRMPKLYKINRSSRKLVMLTREKKKLFIFRFRNLDDSNMFPGYAANNVGSR